MRKCWILFISVINYTSFTSQTYLSGYGSGCRDAVPNCFQRFKYSQNKQYFCVRFGQSCKRFCQMCHSDCQDKRGYGIKCYWWRKLNLCRTNRAAVNCRKTCSFCRQ